MGDENEVKVRLTTLETKWGAVLPTLATKADIADVRADLHKEINAQTWRFITWTTGIGAALVAAAFWIARNVH